MSKRHVSMLESLRQRRRLVHHSRLAGHGRTGRSLLRSEWQLYITWNIRLELVSGYLQLVDAPESRLACYVWNQTRVFAVRTVRTAANPTRPERLAIADK